MNLNKTLCKYLDIEEKGYVCIGDVIYFTLFYGVITALLCGLLYSFYQGYLLIISGGGDVIPYDVCDLNKRAGCFGIAMIIIILIVLLLVCLDYICKIKIAKCEYQKYK